MIRAVVARLFPIIMSLLVLVACTAQTSPSPETTAAETTLAPAEEGASQVFETFGFAIHPNGTQLRVERVEVFEKATVVDVALTNGSLYGIRLDRGLTQLRNDSGGIFPLLEPISQPELQPGSDARFSLRFGPLADVGAITLILNSGGGSSPVSTTTSSPSFEVGPLTLDPQATRPALPDPVAVDRSMIHSLGTDLRIEGIVFVDTRIGVWVRISNPSTVEVALAPTIAPSRLVDDLGNRYPLVLSEHQGAIRIPAGEARAGVLSFAGRIHPSASVLTLALNDGPGGDVADRTAAYPRFRIEGISLSGEQAEAPLPLSMAIGAELIHPNSVTVRIEQMRFTSGSIEADLVLANNGGLAVALAAEPTLIFDDRGNRHPLVPPADNPQLLLEPGTTLQGTFVFSGRVAGEAETATLGFNAGPSGSADDAASRRPAMSFGPYPLERNTEAPPVTLEAKVFAVGPTSNLVDDVLATSTVERITQTLTQFGATEVDGGFKLTLPDTVLFDFNSFELRGDARQALTLIAEVLDYFTGDPVVIVGHTDSIGSQSYNQRLSEQRAQNVVDALIADHGIPQERITAEGRGSLEPVAPNNNPDGTDNPDGRQLNRRVEIVVLTDKALPTG
jgi:outer membrane protein OmpA-like peptidoglycan-associated protein